MDGATTGQISLAATCACCADIHQILNFVIILIIVRMSYDAMCILKRLRILYRQWKTSQKLAEDASRPLRDPRKILVHPVTNVTKQNQ